MDPEGDMPGWRARLVYNETYAAVEQRSAKYMREGRVWAPYAGTEDIQDRVIQRTTSKVMEWEWSDQLQMPTVMGELLQWAQSSSHVCAHIYWDRMRGPDITVQLRDMMAGAELITNPAEQQAFVQKQADRFFSAFNIAPGQPAIYRGPCGDVAFDIAPLFEMDWWPFLPKIWRDVQIGQRTVLKTADQVSEITGLPVEEVRRRAGGSSRHGLDKSRWRDIYHYGESGEYGVDEDMVLLSTIVRRKCRDYPNGRQALVIGNDSESLPPTDIQNPNHEFPFLYLCEKPVRGTIIGTNTVEQMRPAQQHLNTSMSQAADYQATRVAPTLVTFPGNNNQPGALSNKPGKIYEAQSLDKIPQTIKMPDIPVDFFLMAEQDRLWMQNLSGIASIDQGRTDDANVKSGRALYALREQNDSRLKPFGERLDSFFEDAGNLILSMLQEYAVTERILHITGDEGRYEVVKWKGANLQTGDYRPGAPNRFIRVKTFSIIPKSATELSNFVSMALTSPAQDGRTLLDPELDRNEIMNMLGMGEFRKLFDRNRLDVTKQAREIDKWESGLPVGQPSYHDNDAVHIKEILRWQKTESYEVAIATNPMIARDVEFHIDAHKRNEVRKLVEGQYLARRADVSAWLEHRARLIQDIAAGALQAQSPEAAKAVLANAQMLADLVLPLPLSAMPQAPAEGEGGEGKKEEGGKGKPGKQDRSDKQGVSKAEQQGAPE